VFGGLSFILVTLTLYVEDSKGNYTSNPNTKLVHWPLMGGLLYLVQRGGAWAGCSALHVFDSQCRHAVQLTTQHAESLKSPDADICRYGKTQDASILVSIAAVNFYCGVDMSAS